MNIINFIEEIYGKDIPISFIKGVWDWQDKKSFQEELNENGSLFINILNENISSLYKYIIEGTFYKGLTCSPDELVNVENTSYTLSKYMAIDFADCEQNGSGIVIEKKGFGYSLNKIIKDIIEWVYENKEFSFEKLNISGIDIFDEYINEEEIISSLEVEKLNIINICDLYYERSK